MDKWKQAEDKRPLTPAEQARKAAFEAMQASLAAEGYRPHDLTIGMIYANVMTLAIGLRWCFCWDSCFSGFMACPPSWRGVFPFP